MSENRVGVRELKTRLGAHLRKVREGRTLIVTDRGEPVAEIRPIRPESDLDAALIRLEAHGSITRPTRRELLPFKPIENRGAPASDAVVEDREDRG